MASTTTQHQRSLLLAVLLLASPAAMLAATVCGAEKFPAGLSYATCADLPTLGATLHWTYDATASLLSVAFVAKPDGADGAGWVSWAINPTGHGMKGSQALLAFKGAGSAYTVNTYNLTGHGRITAASTPSPGPEISEACQGRGLLVSGAWCGRTACSAPGPGLSTPIAFRATDLAADESGGKVRLYGKLQLPQGMNAVNYIWSVGSTVTNGEPIKHSLAKDFLDAKGNLVLAGGAQEPAPAPAAGGQSGQKSTAATAYASAPGLMLLALVGLLMNI